MSKQLFIDAKNLLCPLPVIKLQNAVKSLEKNDQIKILCTDPGTQQDIPMWCNIHKHKITQTEQPSPREWVYTILVN